MKKKYFNYKLGDTVSCTYKKSWNSKKEQYRKGFIIIEYVLQNTHRGRGFWATTRDFSLCKTTFSNKIGNGSRNFKKIQLITCGVLLVEKKIDLNEHFL